MYNISYLQFTLRTDPTRMQCHLYEYLHSAQSITVDRDSLKTRT